MNKNVLCIGDSSYDVFLAPSETETVCSVDTKECLICFEYGDKIPVESFATSVGGNAANVAVGLVRLNVSVQLQTILGGDLFSDEIARTLTSEGISSAQFIYQEQAKSNYSAIINYSGERTIFSYHSPKSYVFLDPEDVPDWVYLTSIGHGFEAVYDKVVSYCQSYKIPLILNPGSLQIRADHEKLLNYVKSSSMLFVNKEEALKILGWEDGFIQAIVEGLSNLGPKICVVTDGPEGSYATNGQTVWHCPILPRKPEERTGAGDAYTSGFISTIVKDGEISEAMLVGTVNAASVIGHIGGQKGLLREREKHQWLEEARKSGLFVSEM